jgi:hypothetical protein
MFGKGIEHVVINLRVIRGYSDDIGKLKRCINEKTKNNDHGGKTKV